MPRLLYAHHSSEVARDSSAPKRRPHKLKREDSTSRYARSGDARVQSLLGCETSFVGSDSFRNPATARRLRMFAQQMERASVPSATGSYSTKNATLATCAVGMTELLSPSEEREAFLCLNYLKWQANVLRATIDPAAATESLITEIEALHRQALIVRDRIISANLRLVMSIAKAQAEGRLKFDELFSEGVPVLMRAVEKFDVERGFRFSTYAYTAVRRTLHQAKADAHRHNRRQLTSVEPSVLDRMGDSADSTDFLPESAVPLVHELLERLPPRENFVVRARFGMLPNQADCTLQEVGRLVGVSKERARQLLNRAFAHLRTLVEQSRYADLQELAD
jgi:RNA polymerase primary sigma factor